MEAIAELPASVPSRSVLARSSWPLRHSTAALDAISGMYGQLEMWAQGSPPTSDELVSRAAAAAVFASSVLQPGDDATASLARFLAEGGATALSCALDYTVIHLSADPAVRMQQLSACSGIMVVFMSATRVASIRGVLPSLVALWRADQATAELAVNSIGMILLKRIEPAVLRRLGIFELAEATLRVDGCPAALRTAVVRLLSASASRRVCLSEPAARVAVPISLVEPVLLQARHNAEAVPEASRVLQHWLQRDDSRDACIAAILASDAPVLLIEALKRCGSVETAASYFDVLAAVVAAPESAASSPPLSLVLLPELVGLLRAHASDGSTAAVGRLVSAVLLAAPAVPASSEAFPARSAALLDIGAALTAALTAAAAAETLDSGLLAPILRCLHVLSRCENEIGPRLLAAAGFPRALGRALARTRGDGDCATLQEDAVAALSRCLQQCVCEGASPDKRAVAAAALADFDAEGGLAALAELVKNLWESSIVAAHGAAIFAAAFQQPEDRVKAAAAATPWEFGLTSALNFHESSIVMVVASALRAGVAHSPVLRRKLVAELAPNLGRLVTAHLHHKDALRELVGLCSELAADAAGKSSLVQPPCTLLGALLSAWEAEEADEGTASILMGALGPLCGTSEGRAALVAPAARDLVIRALHRYAVRSEPSARKDVFNMLGLVFEMVRDKGACAAAVAADSVSALMATLVARPEDSGVLRRVAGCLSDMARDPAGQVAILTCTEGLGVLVAGLQRACGEQAIAINCSILCYNGIDTDASGVGEAFRSALVAAGIGQPMVSALAAHAVSGKMETVRPVARALAALAKDESCRRDMLSHDLTTHVAAAMTTHGSEMAVVAQLAALIAVLCRNPAARNAFVVNGTLASLLRLMRRRGQTDKELAVRLLPALVGLLPAEGAPAAFVAAEAGSTLLHFAQSLSPADRGEAVSYAFQLLMQLARFDERLRAAQAASASFVATLLLLLRTRDGPEVELLLHAAATLSREPAGRLKLLEQSGVEALTAVLQHRITNLGAAGAGCYALRRLADPSSSAAPAVADGSSSSAAVPNAALAAASAHVPAAAWARAADLLLAVMQQHDGSTAIVADAARALGCLMQPSLHPAGTVAAVKAALREKDGVTLLQVLQATHADSNAPAAAALGRVCVLLLHD